MLLKVAVRKGCDVCDNGVPSARNLTTRDTIGGGKNNNGLLLGDEFFYDYKSSIVEDVKIDFHIFYIIFLVESRCCCYTN